MDKTLVESSLVAVTCEGRMTTQMPLILPRCFFSMGKNALNFLVMDFPKKVDATTKLKEDLRYKLRFCEDYTAY